MQMTDFQIVNVPDELVRLQQWVCWKRHNGTKVPIQSRITTDMASSTDPVTWSTFDDAVTACDLYAHLESPGFVFTMDDPFVGVDLDACIDDRGKIADWALTILARFDTYAEISPSGTGLKLWCRGEWDAKNRATVQEQDGKNSQIEVYSHKRYFAVTGNRWEGCDSSTVKSAQSALDWLHEKYFSEPEAKPAAPQYIPRPKTDVSERARRYLERVPPAVSGSGGHDRTFHAACILVLGFGMSVDEAWPVIAEWNQSCEPPWSEYDLRRKLNEASKQNEQRGYLLTGEQYTGPDADLSALLKSLEHVTLEAITPERLAVDEFPDWTLDPPGFLSEVIDYNLRTANYPLPHMALAGSLALLATVTGHKIEDSLWGTRTNCYICGLAPTRGGKDKARRVNQSLLHASGLEELEGEENFASSASIYAAMAENPVSLYQLDEINSLLAVTQDARNSHLYKIRDTFLRLYSSAVGTLKGDAYADRAKNKVIHYPHCVLYGNAVPVGFWQSITAENMTDGLLGRLMLFEVPEKDNGYVDPQKPERIPLPASAIQTMQAWRQFKPHDGNLAAVDGSNPVSLIHTPEAEERAWQHMKDVCDRSKSEPVEVAGVWRGTPEKTNKLALLFAASRVTADDIDSGRLPSIELDDVDMAVAVSNWMTRRMLHQAGLHIAETPWQKLVQKTLRRFKVGEEVTKSEFTRRTQYVRSKEREEILQQLLESGQLTGRILEGKQGSTSLLVTRTR